MVSWSKTGIGLVILLLGLWTSGFMGMIPVLGDILGFLPPMALPDIIPGFSTGLIVLIIGVLVTAWGIKSYY
jgi:hypothetical protein